MCTEKKKSWKKAKVKPEGQNLHIYDSRGWDYQQNIVKLTIQYQDQETSVSKLASLKVALCPLHPMPCWDKIMTGKVWGGSDPPFFPIFLRLSCASCHLPKEYPTCPLSLPTGPAEERSGGLAFVWLSQTWLLLEGAGQDEAPWCGWAVFGVGEMTSHQVMHHESSLGHGLWWSQALHSLKGLLFPHPLWTHIAKLHQTTAIYLV